MNEMELLKEVELQSHWADVAIAIASGDSKLAVDSASDLICRQFTFKTMLDNEELWFYESGYYKNSGENIVKKIIQDCVEIKLKISSRFINEVIASVKRKTYLDREAFEAPVHLICVGNGVFDIDGGELLPHDPKYFFKSKININYNPQADCRISAILSNQRLKKNIFGQRLKFLLICFGENIKSKKQLC